MGGTPGPELIPFRDYDIEIRTVSAQTNAIESLNVRYRLPLKARGHFPTEQTATKMPLPGHPDCWTATGKGQARWTMRWKTSAERLRHHLRRPLAGSRNLRMKTGRKHRSRYRPLAGADSSANPGCESHRYVAASTAQEGRCP